MSRGRPPGRVAAASSFALALACWGFVAKAQPAPLAAPATESPYIIEVLTFGPGDHPFTRFGHDALRVVDRRSHDDRVYNFGTFSIAAHGLIGDFLKGRLHYWLSRSPTAETIEDYRLDNRSIEAQTLNLTADEQRELVRRLEENVRPENREYRYDYFYDNCATRVRDALDAVTGGAVRAASSQVQGARAWTLREQALRMAADDLPLYGALLVVLGPSTDRPIAPWIEDFLPQMLQRTLRTVRLAGPTPRLLVASERVVFAARRPPPREAPPAWTPRFLAIGVAAGLLLLLLARVGRRLWVARALFGAALAVGGALLGFIGTFLLGAWMATPHAVVYRNQNILLCAPFALALTVLGIGVAMGWPGATRKAFLVTAAATAFALAACLIKILPFAHQDNTALIALLLPVWAGMALGTRSLAAR
ncbi:MAG TPA: DUF4105 domain-containing protein [Polyangia bacterium]